MQGWSSKLPSWRATAVSAGGGWSPPAPAGRAPKEWLANSEAAGEWDDAAFATQSWLKLSPAELREFSEELVTLTQRWRHRDIVDDDTSERRCSSRPRLPRPAVAPLRPHLTRIGPPVR
jgi:hypothetical protein